MKETQLRSIRPGQRAEVEVDSLPGRSFKGTVDSIAAGTGATFALLPPDNATGNFTKVVQRVPVKVVLDAGQKDINLLRSGLSAVVTVNIR
jgi:membrane fusion protein (multidrug efflux system)